MAIIFNCKCGKAFRAKETQAGKTFPCTECGRAVHVPGTPPVQDDVDPYFIRPTTPGTTSTSGAASSSTVPNPPASVATHVVVHHEHADSNGLGVAGFVLALVGFLTCGLLSPVGLIFSLFGLRKRPRGLAIAGSVLGLLGSWWLFLFGFAFLGMLGLGGLLALDDASNPKERPSDPPKITRRAPQAPAPGILREPVPQSPTPRPKDRPESRPIPQPRKRNPLASFTETFVNVPEGGLPTGWEASDTSVGVLGTGALRRLQASASGTHRITTPSLEFPDDFELELRADGDFTVTLQGVDGQLDLPLSIQRGFGAAIRLDDQSAGLNIKDRDRTVRIRLVRDGSVCRVIVEDLVLIEYQIGRDRQFGVLVFDIKGGGGGTSVYEVRLSPHPARLPRREFTPYLEAFRSSPEGSVPSGWSGADISVQSGSLRSHAGAPRVAYTPPLVFPHNFEIEVLGTLASDRFSNNTTVIYLEGKGNGPDLRVSVAADFAGAHVTFPRSEPKQVRIPLGAPARVVLERDEGIYRLLINGQTLFARPLEAHVDFARIGFILDKSSSIDRVELRTKGTNAPGQDEELALRPPVTTPPGSAGGLVGSFKTSAPPLAIVFSHRGELLAVAGDGSTYRWDFVRALSAGRPLPGILGRSDAANARPRAVVAGPVAVLKVPGADALGFAPAAISRDGRFVALGQASGRVRHFESEARESRPRELEGEPLLECLAYSPQGDPNRLRLAMGFRSGVVDVIDCASGSRAAHFPTLGDRGPITSLTFATDGLVVTGHELGNAVVWSWSDSGEGRRKGELNSPKRAHRGAVGAIVFSPDGKRLATGGADRAVRIWDARSHSLLYELQSQFPVISVDVDQQGEKLAAGGEGGQLAVWAQGARKPRQISEVAAHQGRVALVAFAPDGKHIATAGTDGFVKLWGPRLWDERNLEAPARPLTPDVVAEAGRSRVEENDGRPPTHPAEPAHVIPRSMPSEIDVPTAPSGKDGPTTPSVGARPADLASDPRLEVVISKNENTTFRTVLLTVQATNVSTEAIMIDKLIIRAKPGGDQVRDFKPTALRPGEKRTLKSASIPISAKYDVSFQSPDGKPITYRQK